MWVASARWPCLKRGSPLARWRCDRDRLRVEVMRREGLYPCIYSGREYRHLILNTPKHPSNESPRLARLTTPHHPHPASPPDQCRPRLITDDRDPPPSPLLAVSDNLTAESPRPHPTRLHPRVPYPAHTASISASSLRLRLRPSPRRPAPCVVSGHRPGRRDPPPLSPSVRPSYTKVVCTRRYMRPAAHA